MTAMMSPISFGPPRHLENAAEWLHALAELAQKRAEYFGSRLVWLIDPRDRTVAVHHAPGIATRVLDDAALLDGEEVLPVFSIAVVDLFRDVPA
jgi:Uma2 family endonuclease